LPQIKIENVSKTSLKSSQEKNLKKQILDQNPKVAEIINDIWSKKSTVLLSKLKNYANVYFINDEPMFMQIKDGPIFPHIKLLHKYPFLLPTCQVDKGAIPFVIGGANVMCPGLTSKGGRVADLKADSIVAILCEGKEHTLAIGQTTMSGNEM
jgi:PUA domain protein